MTVHAFKTRRQMLILLLALGVLAGCGDRERSSSKATSAPEAERTASGPAASSAKHKTRRQPRAVRSEGTPVATPSVATYVACDPNITVKVATTTCPFAQNVFYGYWNADGGDFRAYSPASQESYDIACDGGATIVCTAGDGAEVRFSPRAVALYDQAQADSYAASHDLGPQPETVESDGYEYDDDEAYADDDYEDHGDYDDDEGYNDGDGATEPGENIPYYDEGRGYRVQCADGTYSQSGGVQGACSHHGGIG
jgi:hypothetical protein